MDSRDSLVDRRTEHTCTGVVHAPSPPTPSLSVSATTRSVLKGYFQTGSVPTQANFADFIDSCLIPDAKGNVGLGVATPTATLDVAGTVNATAFTGSGAGLTGIPVAALSGALTVPAANVTGVLTASQVPPLSALSGQLTPAQLPPSAPPSGGGVASGVQFANGASIAAAGAGIQMQVAARQQTTQAYSNQTCRTTFSMGPGLGPAGFSVNENGLLLELHVPFVIVQSVLQAGVTVQLTSIVNTATNAPIFPPPGGAPVTATQLLADPVVAVPPPAGAGGQAVYFEFSSLNVSVEAGARYHCMLSILPASPDKPLAPEPYWYNANLSTVNDPYEPVGCTVVTQSGEAGAVTISPAGVGIGTSAPSQALEVAGTIKCAGLIQTSDARLKTAVVPLGDVLSRVASLRPVTFRWIDEAFPGAATAGAQVGFIAQAVEAVFPELVQTDARGLKAMDYSRLSAALVGAARELAAENAALRTRLEHFEQRLARLEPAAGRSA